MIHEVKRYDGEGNLLGVISEKDCRRDFWRQLDIDADSGERSGEMKLLKTFGEEDARGPIVLGPYRANKKKIPGTCLNCGTNFMGKSAQKFCSDIAGGKSKEHCRNIYYKMVKSRKQRAILPPKPCALCGKSFVPKHDNREKYCHSPCNWQIANYGPSVLHTYKCMVCGNNFKSGKRRAYAKYCHNPCDPKAMAKIKRDKANNKGAKR